MRPTDSVRDQEPLFQLECVKCGWRFVFSTTPEITAGIVVKVREHRCPEPKPAVKRCVKCRREIGELRTRCPYCGADNPLLPE